MARLGSQIIPSGMLQAYHRTLRHTVPVRHPGTEHEGLDNAAGRRYPEHTEPPHVPTPAQLAARAAFKASANCWDPKPATEKECWEALDLDHADGGYRYWHHVHIPLFADGHTCSEYSEPQASAYAWGQGTGAGRLRVVFDSPGEFSIRIKFTSDYLAYEQHWEWLPVRLAWTIQVFDEGVWTPEPPAQFFLRSLPWEYSRWDHDSLTTINNLPAGPVRVAFYRSGAQPDPLALWRFYPEGLPYTYDLAEAFGLPPNP